MSDPFLVGQRFGSIPRTEQIVNRKRPAQFFWEPSPAHSPVETLNGSLVVGRQSEDGEVVRAAVANQIYALHDRHVTDGRTINVLTGLSVALAAKQPAYAAESGTSFANQRRTEQMAVIPAPAFRLVLAGLRNIVDDPALGDRARLLQERLEAQARAQQAAHDTAIVAQFEGGTPPTLPPSNPN